MLEARSEYPPIPYSVCLSYSHANQSQRRVGGFERCGVSPATNCDCCSRPFLHSHKAAHWLTSYMEWIIQNEFKQTNKQVSQKTGHYRPVRAQERRLNRRGNKCLYWMKLFIMRKYKCVPQNVSQKILAPLTNASWLHSWDHQLSKLIIHNTSKNNNSLQQLCVVLWLNTTSCENEVVLSRTHTTECHPELLTHVQPCFVHIWRWATSKVPQHQNG